MAGDASLMDPRPTLGGAFNSHCSVAGYGDQTYVFFVRE